MTRRMLHRLSDGRGKPASGSAERHGRECEYIADREIVLTENAARRIAILRDQEQAENAFLRISVSGGGCSGFQYGFAFDEQRHADDFVFERDGVAVVVDDVSLGLLNGAEVDFSSRI